MYLRTILNTTLLLLLALTLDGCINATSNNPVQPSTTPEPVTTPPATPGSTAPKTLPLTGFRAITAGRNHGCIIKNSDSTLWCWGQNASGQVGTNNSAEASTFQKIGSDYLWQNISGGYSHTCGVALSEVTDPADASKKISINRLLCWGDNSTGAIGYGSAVPKYFDPMVLADDDWSVVSAGNNHSCAIRLDGTLWCWGDNSNSQLGHNSADKTRPSQVSSDKDWSSISASDQFTCALKQNHTLWCWGKNDKSQFGDGTTTSATIPSQIVAHTDWTNIATGQAHSCGIRSDNTLWCWGDNSYGQIGNGTINIQSTPLKITTSTVTKWSTVATGHQHTCAIASNVDTDGKSLTDDKTLWCWGNNDTGQLGINSTAHQSRPIKISHSKGWLLVSAGESHSCAVDKDEIVHCWGFNDHGQLANGFYTDTGLPRTFDLSSNWRTIASGYHHSCGLKGSSAPYTLWCSGFNSYGQLGIGSTSNQSTLTQISANNGDIIHTWESLSTGPNHSCAIAINGAKHLLFCWGNNSHGQLGSNIALNNLGNNITIGNSPQYWWPNGSTQVVAGGIDDWRMVAAGANNSCGIKGLNELWCWGDNSSGQIANGYTPSSLLFAPTRIAGSWLTVTVGGVEDNGGHICAIKTEGTLWCWGKNDTYQLGNYIPPTPAPSLTAGTDLSTPNEVNTDTDWVAVKAGERHTCALKSSGALWCWGDNSRGQTGTLKDKDPFPTTTTSPKQENTGTSWFDFDTGSNFTCAIDNSAHSLWCWGDNLYKQLTAVVAKEDQFTPFKVQSDTNWQQLTLGQRHGCGIQEDSKTLDRQSYCWGEGAPYQFGNGDAWKTTPQPLSLN